MRPIVVGACLIASTSATAQQSDVTGALLVTPISVNHSIYSNNSYYANRKDIAERQLNITAYVASIYRGSLETYQLLGKTIQAQCRSRDLSGGGSFQLDNNYASVTNLLEASIREQWSSAPISRHVILYVRGSINSNMMTLSSIAAELPGSNSIVTLTCRTDT